MTPLSFETVAEQQCFGAMVNSIGIKFYLSKVYLINLCLEIWPYNLNYWTAGKGRPGNYSWCGAKGEVPIIKENIWDLQQPDFKLAECFFFLVSYC